MNIPENIAAAAAALLSPYCDGLTVERLQSALEAKPTPRERPVPITLKAAADILGVHPITAQRWASAGRLKQIRLSPRKIRYDKNQIERLAYGDINQ